MKTILNTLAVAALTLCSASAIANTAVENRFSIENIISGTNNNNNHQTMTYTASSGSSAIAPDPEPVISPAEKACNDKGSYTEYGSCPNRDLYQVTHTWTGSSCSVTRTKIRNGSGCK